jgi:hypothetical protein
MLRFDQQHRFRRGADIPRLQQGPSRARGLFARAFNAMRTTSSCRGGGFANHDSWRL